MIKILALNHNKLNLKNIQTTLSRLIPDVQLLQATVGANAISIAQKNNPDVILLESQSPTSDCLEVCRRLKEDIRTCEIPVLFITKKNSNRSFVSAAIECGGEGLLTHPFDEMELMAQIRAMVKLKKASRAEQDLKIAMQLSKEQEQFSKLNAEISTDLIDINIDNFDKKIHSALAKTGKHAKADRAFIFLFKEDKTLMDNAFEWCAPKIKSNIDDLKDVTVHSSSWWLKKLIRKEHVYISGINQKELTPEDKELLVTNDVTSLLGVPVFKGGELLGFLGLNTTAEEKSWNEFHIQTLKSIATSIASALFSVQNQRQLLVAKEKAEESDRLKSAFLANMSHEIRTPMNGIMGFLDLIQNNGNTQKEQNLYFEMVKKSSSRLLTTITDIIEISKIESGQTPVVHSIENVNEIMNFLYNSFLPEAEEKGVSLLLSKNIQDNIDKTIRIKTDKIKLEVILKNLLGNAIKFTSDGSVEMDYTLTKNSITFCIKDTGPGIAQNRIEAIFDHFVQADLDITRPYEGAGLGLTITRAYAEMLHGKIGVESELGKGSKFYFTLNHDSVLN